MLNDAENGEVLPSLLRKGVEQLVSPVTRVAGKQSIRMLKRSRSTQDVSETQKEVTKMRRAYLPNFAPLQCGRIINTTQTDSVQVLPIARTARVEGSHARIRRDIAMVKQEFVSLRESNPETDAVWGADLVHLLGCQGRVLQQTQEVCLVAFGGDEDPGIWFPLKTLESTPVSSQGKLSFEGKKPSTRRFSFRSSSSKRSLRPAFLDAKQKESPSQTPLQSPSFPVPKERTMSFLLNPVHGDDELSREDVEQRSRIGERRSLDATSQDPLAPRLATKNLLDRVWDGDTTEIEACAQADAAQVNRRGTGVKDFWDTHIDSHPGLGLGRRLDSVYPIHVAIAKGDERVVRQLLVLGADTSARSQAGYNAREQACISAALAVSRGDFSAASRAMQLAALIDTHAAGGVDAILPVSPAESLQESAQRQIMKTQPQLYTSPTRPPPAR